MDARRDEPGLRAGQPLLAHAHARDQGRQPPLGDGEPTARRGQRLVGGRDLAAQPLRGRLLALDAGLA